MFSIEPYFSDFFCLGGDLRCDHLQLCAATFAVDGGLCLAASRFRAAGNQEATNRTGRRTGEGPILLHLNWHRWEDVGPILFPGK